MKGLIVIILIVAFLIVPSIAVKFFIKPNVASFSSTNSIRLFDQNYLFDLIQRYRFENNLSPYKKSYFLCEIADKRLVETTTSFSHVGFEANRFCSSICTLGENLAKEWGSEEATYKSWINSPTHKKNLDADFTHSCLKCKGSACVQIFGYY